MSRFRLASLIDRPRALLRSVLALGDSPHRLAAGIAMGIFWGLTPTVGIQTILVLSSAFLLRPLFRFNSAAAVVFTYISNPITMVPLYYGLYWLGTHFVEGGAGMDDFQQLLIGNEEMSLWQKLTAMVTQFGVPLAIGTALVAPTGGLLTYPLARLALNKMRRPRRPQGPAAPVNDSPPAEQQTSPEQTSEASPDSTPPILDLCEAGHPE